MHITPTSHSTPANKYRNLVGSEILDSKTQKLDFAAFAYSGYRDVSFKKIETLQINRNPLYHALEFNKDISEGTINQWLVNTIAKQAIAAFRNQDEKAEAYSQTITKTAELISEILGYEIEFELQENPLDILIKHDGLTYDFDVLSDGQKSLLSWIADLLMRLDQVSWKTDTPILDRAFILFLDEIEIHLHPAIQRKILPVIQKTFKNAQIFVTTHSPFVINSIGDAWVYKLKVDANKNGNLASKHILKAGDSIQVILDEIFEVNEEFDIFSEKLLDEFYSIRNKVVHGEDYDKLRLEELSKVLSNRSEELHDIISKELNQIKKLSKDD